MLSRGKRYIAVAALLLWIVVNSSPLAADIVHLKSGGTVEGRVEEKQDRVTVTLSSGSMDILKSQIERIEKKALPQDIFAGRLKNLIDKKDIEGCITLAEWAWSQDLEPQYVTALRTALLLDKKNKTARKMLRDYQLRLAILPHNEKADEKIRKEMGQEFVVLRTRHYRIGYNCSEFFANLTAQRLENVYRQFLDVFQARKFEPAPISDRLEVILFDTREQFRRHARSHEKKTWNSAGFYSDRTRRSYFFDAYNDGNYRRQLRKLDGFQEQLELNREEVLAGDGDNYYIVTNSDGSQDKLNRRQMLIRLQDHEAELESQFERLRDSYQEMNINVTIHEATHQLAYNCGIHNRYFNNPVWLVEGLALYFEAAAQSHWNKPGEIHPQRLELFVRSCQTLNPISLETLIKQDNLFSTQNANADITYATAWALFYYLVWQQQEKLFDYMYDLSLRMSEAPYEAEERKKDFESYFGNLEQLEKHWRYYMTSLQP
jgi:uncharacterized protein DUF1570